MLRVLQKDRACFIWMWQSLMCVWNCGWSVCVWVCVDSDALYSARSFCLAKPSSLWPLTRLLSLSSSPSIPLSFFHIRLLSPSISLLPLLFSLSVFIALCWWFCYPNGEEQKESWLWGPPCLCVLISYTEELYITNPLRKTHAMWRHCMFS